MTARKSRGMAPAGLFWNTARDDQDQAETRDNPRLRPCPWPSCRALPGQPCTVPTGRGRRKPLSGYHHARTPDQSEPPATAPHRRLQDPQ